MILVHTRIHLYPQHPQYLPCLSALTNRSSQLARADSLVLLYPSLAGKQIEELRYLLQLPFMQLVYSDRAVHPHKLKTNQIIGLSTHRPHRTFLFANGSFIIYVNCIRPPSGSPSTPSCLHKSQISHFSGPHQLSKRCGYDRPFCGTCSLGDIPPEVALAVYALTITSLGLKPRCLFYPFQLSLRSSGLTLSVTTPQKLN